MFSLHQQLHKVCQLTLCEATKLALSIYPAEKNNSNHRHPPTCTNTQCAAKTVLEFTTLSSLVHLSYDEIKKSIMSPVPFNVAVYGCIWNT